MLVVQVIIILNIDDRPRESGPSARRVSCIGIGWWRSRSGPGGRHVNGDVVVNVLKFIVNVT